MDTSSQFPSCEIMFGLARAFMGQELPENELEQMDGRTLLALVEEPAVRIAVLKQKCAIVDLKDRMYVKKLSFTIKVPSKSSLQITAKLFNDKCPGP